VAYCVRNSVQTGRPSWLARGAFVLLLLCYAYLIWFSLWGAWEMLGPIQFPQPTPSPPLL
jgi:hypothetical protein